MQPFPRPDRHPQSEASSQTFGTWEVFERLFVRLKTPRVKPTQKYISLLGWHGLCKARLTVYSSLCVHAVRSSMRGTAWSLRFFLLMVWAILFEVHGLRESVYKWDFELHFKIVTPFWGLSFWKQWILAPSVHVSVLRSVCKAKVCSRVSAVWELWRFCRNVDFLTKWRG